MSALALAPRRVAQALIRLYQLTLSGLLGRQCRYLPTCSAYADEAIARHGLWAGSWMGFARVCRCRPLGGSGYDPPPVRLAAGASWAWPWRYGVWRSTAPGGGSPFEASEAEPGKAKASQAQGKFGQGEAKFGRRKAKESQIPPNDSCAPRRAFPRG